MIKYDGSGSCTCRGCDSELVADVNKALTIHVASRPVESVQPLYN